MKIVCWDRNGLCLSLKRLHKTKPNAEEPIVLTV
ncbi:hypothetical protein ACA097_19845 [Pseudomonas sp. QL9]